MKEIYKCKGFLGIYLCQIFVKKKNGLDVLCFHTGKSRYDKYCTKCFVENGSLASHKMNFF